MSEVMHDYSDWTYQRWEECCEEREAFGEVPITFSEYMHEYQTYLRDEYINEKDALCNTNS